VVVDVFKMESICMLPFTLGSFQKSAAMVPFRIVWSILESMAYKAALSSLSFQKYKIMPPHYRRVSQL